jgi:hypothetical protein
MSRPKGITGHKKNRVLEAEIARLELALAFSRQRAIRAGLRLDVLNNAKFTAECIRLTTQIESLMFQIQPSALELARDYDNVT